MNTHSTKPSARLLIVEDDIEIAETLRTGLEESHFHVEVAHTPAVALDMVGRHLYELVLLDLGLPGKDGLDLLNDFRQQGFRKPVIILTARADVGDRVLGLQRGADDYIAKPFAFSELVARIDAVLRRVGDQDTLLNFEDLKIDRINRIVTRAGDQINLTQREFDLLVYFVCHQGRVVSRDMLARNVWKISSRATPMDGVIDVNISRLRTKLKEGAHKDYLQTVRGLGFIMQADT